MVCFMPESPHFLKAVGREAELVATLEQIARWNCKKLKLRSSVAEDGFSWNGGSEIHHSLLEDQ